MNTFLNRLSLTAALAVGLASLAGAQSPAYVPNEINVKFRPSAVGSSRLAHMAINARVKSQIPSIGWQTIRLRPGMSVPQALSYYRRMAGVERAEPNYIRKGYFAPNDPRYNGQWWLPKVGSAAAWDFTLGDSGVKIAVIDSGVDYNHEDLRGKVLLGRDYVNDDNDPMDDQGHGTHVAGIAAASTNNGVGVAGLGFNCSIMAFKVLGADGFGSTAWSSEAIVDAADAGVDVINLSLGGAGETQMEKDAVAHAASKGVVIVAAAGNDGTTNRGYPGSFEECICVAATDENDQKAGFSTYGADWVDVAAPGVAILSTMPNNGYAENQGTSMASPVVAGLAGLLKAYSPSSTAAEIRAVIEDNVVDVGDFVAKGRINAPAALGAIIRPVDLDLFAKDASVLTDSGFTHGRNVTGTYNDLKVADSKWLSLETMYQPGNGYTAAAVITMNFNTALENVIDADLLITHRSKRIATNSVFLYNYDKGKYEVLKSVPGSDVAVTSTIALPKDMTPYLQNGAFRMVVRSYVSARNARHTTGYRFYVDRAMVQAKIKP